MQCVSFNLTKFLMFQCEMIVLLNKCQKYLHRIIWDFGRLIFLKALYFQKGRKIAKTVKYR